MPEPTTWHFNKNRQSMAVEVNGPIGADSSDVLVRLAVGRIYLVRAGDN